MKTNFFIGFFLGLLLAGCSLSQPAAKPNSPPKYYLKFVPYSQNKSLHGYFCLADSATNQTASAGVLRIQVFTQTSLTMGGTGAGMCLTSSIYDNTFMIGVTNFHWEKFGSFLSVRDLTMRFVVPYAHFNRQISSGKQASIKLDFSPDGMTNRLSISKNVILY